MNSTESDVRVLVAETRNQKQAIDDLAGSVKDMVSEVHSLVNETVKSNTRVNHVEKTTEDHEKRIRDLEKVQKGNAPVIAMIVNVANKAVPTLVVAAILGLAGLFYANPFK